MELSDYRWKWQAIGKQLATVLTDQEALQIEALFGDDAWGAATAAEWDAAADWLALPPARIAKKWAKVSADQRPVLMLRIQYLCCLSANTAAAAEVFERLRGKDSRQDLADAARALHWLQLEPTEQDMRDAIYG